MPLYRYEAVGRDGRTVTGEDTAPDAETLKRRLVGRRLVITRVLSMAA